MRTYEGKKGFATMIGQSGYGLGFGVTINADCPQGTDPTLAHAHTHMM